MDNNKELLNKENNQSKTEILKNEWCNFFWKRLVITLPIGLILGIFLKQGSSSYQFISGILGYLLSSFLIMRMINGNHSKLILKNKNGSIKTDYFETLKIYWSFYWREFIYGLLLGLIIGVFVFMFVILALNKGFAIFLAFLLVIFMLIGIYYIGRHVFIEVVKEVCWNDKTLDVKK